MLTQSYAVIYACSSSAMFCLSGKGPVLSSEVFPPYDVSEGQWEIGLVDLSTYNSIPNIEKNVNDKFIYKFNNNEKHIVFEEGSYEIEDIEAYILSKVESGVELKLKANSNTLKVQLITNVEIDFTKEQTIGPLLGFSQKILNPGTHLSDSPDGVNIIKVNVIRVECNIARGSFQNGHETHLVHEFFPLVQTGYKLVEVPTTILYMPLNVQKINNITISLKDQDGFPVNFRNETISVRLHVRKNNGFGI